MSKTGNDAALSTNDQAPERFLRYGNPEMSRAFDNALADYKATGERCLSFVERFKLVPSQESAAQSEALALQNYIERLEQQEGLTAAQRFFDISDTAEAPNISRAEALKRFEAVEEKIRSLKNAKLHAQAIFNPLFEDLKSKEGRLRPFYRDVESGKDLWYAHDKAGAQMIIWEWEIAVSDMSVRAARKALPSIDDARLEILIATKKAIYEFFRVEQELVPLPPPKPLTSLELEQQARETHARNAETNRLALIERRKQEEREELEAMRVERDRRRVRDEKLAAPPIVVSGARA